MIDTNWPQLPLNAREALRKAQLRGVASLTGEERAVLDTVPAGDLVTTRCHTCRTPVTPGHTGHDGPLVDGEEAFWCEDCCPRCNQREETEVKQTIEVEVGPEDENGWCRVESVGADGAHYVTGVPADTLRDIGLTVPEPEPPLPPEPRAECAFYRFDSTGSLALADEVLVPAHSLRAGDRVEWAPGDWREITQVEEHRLATILWVDDEPFTRNHWDLVAVRR